jgi:hypothetical protein
VKLASSLTELAVAELWQVNGRRDPLSTCRGCPLHAREPPEC